MFNKNLNNLKIVYLSIQNKLPVLLGRIFTKSNLNKIIIIFIAGFISRVLIVYFYNVNVFFEYLNIISILYYSFMSFFIVIVHEVINYFEFNIIPAFIIELYSIFVNVIKNILNIGQYLRKTLNSANKLIFSLNLSDWTISSIKKDYESYLNREKMIIDIDKTDNKEKIVNKVKDNTIKDNILQKNQDLKSSRGRGRVSDKGNSSNVGNRLPSNYPTPGESPRRNDGYLFTVETIRDSMASAVGEPERNLRSTAPTPVMPPAPNIDASNLSTPSISTLNTNDSPRFPNLTNAIYSPNDNSSVATKPVNNYTYKPVVNNASVSTSNNTYYPLTNSTQGVHYPANNSSNTSANKHDTYYGHGYFVPDQVPYFNPYDVTNVNNPVTKGSNIPKEVISQLNTQNAYVAYNPENHQSYFAKREFVKKNLAKEYQMDEKEAISPTMPNEIAINKKGLLGRIKLAFNFGDAKLNKTNNVDSIIVKYKDITKRKFFWTLWEKKSGNYETYLDFKESWDPNRSIWDEIKKRTKRDIQVDVENVLGIHRNVKGLGYTPRKGLGVSNVKTEVDNLVQNKQPFNAPIIENGEQSSQGIESSHKSSSRKHSHSHSHSRSHSDNHSHSGSHSHHRHHRSHNNVSTERRSHSHRHHHHHHHRSHSNDNTERRSHERSSSSNRPAGRSYSRNNFI